jgi:hypothetical protein
MALKGTLADLGIIDLIQFPHAGRKTGKFVIAFDSGEALLYYEKGSLVHAVASGKSGLEALVFVVGLDQGSFEFHGDEPPPETTIQMDLHHAVMQALKLHDERKAAEAESQQEGADRQQGNGAAVAKLLMEHMSASDFILHACVLNADGSIHAAADGKNGAIEGVEQLREMLQSFVATYPRPNVDRVFVLDELGTVVIVCLSEQRRLVLVAARDVPLGVVSLSVNKLVSTLATAS